MSIFVNNIGNLAQRLQNEFENTSSELHHPGVKGSIREDILKEVLRDIIPCKQQDFILYDAFTSPSFLKRQTEVIIPVESVYATIEVKSTLDKRTLEQSVENVRSVKSLEKNYITPNFLPLQSTNYIYSAVFAYTSSIRIEDVLKKLIELNKDIPYDEQISAICILDKGNILHVDRDDIRNLNTRPSRKTTTLVKPNTLDQNLYLFYIMLQSHLNYTLNFPPDLWKYATINGSFKDKGICIPIEAITDDVNIPITEDFMMRGSDYKRFFRIQPYLFKIITKEMTEKDIVDSDLENEEFINECKWAISYLGRMRIAFMQGMEEKNKSEDLPE